MTYTIKKNATPRPGRMLTSKIQVKAFKTSDAMHTFLNKQYDNNWSIYINSDVTKSGYYAFLGGKMINLKNVDVSILAHI